MICVYFFIMYYDLDGPVHWSNGSKPSLNEYQTTNEISFTYINEIYYDISHPRILIYIGAALHSLPRFISPWSQVSPTLRVKSKYLWVVSVSLL